LLAAAGWSDVLGSADDGGGGGGDRLPQMHTVWAFTNAAFGAQFSYAERAYLLYGAAFAAGDEELRRDAIEDTRMLAARYVSAGPISLSRLGAGTHTGVVHGVEAVERPADLVLSPQKALVGLNATVFVRLIRDAGLGDYIDGTRPDRKLTLLAPTNGAMADGFDYEPDDDAREVAGPAARLPRDRQREWAQYHIVDGQYGVEELARHPLVRTMLATSWTDHKAQVVKAHVDAALSPLAKRVSFNGADNILPEPAVVGNTTIYLLSEPMPTPPRLVNALIQNLDLSLFVAAMGASGTAGEIQQWPGATVLAPVASAFTSLGLMWSYLSLPGDSDARGDLGRLIRAH
ncbi:hypothetical protein IWQ56_005776, partial [Coemansia nantahalensis]